MQTFPSGYLLFIYNKQFYYNVLQNALIKPLADHHTEDYNVQQDSFV